MSDIDGDIAGEIRVNPIKYSKIFTKIVQKNNPTSGKITVPVEYVNAKVIILFPNSKLGEHEK